MFSPMKLLLTFLVVLLSFMPGHAQSRYATVRMYGLNYVSLADWAKNNKFDITWLRRNEDVQLSSRWSKLTLSIDSRKATFNGVSVWFSAAVALRGGKPYISEVDLNTALNPILFPQKTAKKVKTIMIDPGHGGKDPGNKAGHQEEKKYALLLAKEIRTLLEREGYEVIMTRSTDVYIDPFARPMLANKKKADLFISLHYNSIPGSGSAKGVEVYCVTPAGTSSTNAGTDVGDRRRVEGNKSDSQNVQLAYQIQKALLEKTGGTDRGVRRARFAVLRLVEMPAVLIEGGFMSDPAEARKIYDDAHRLRVARAIVDGVQAYRKQVER